MSCIYFDASNATNCKDWVVNGGQGFYLAPSIIQPLFPDPASFSLSQYVSVRSTFLFGPIGSPALVTALLTNLTCPAPATGTFSPEAPAPPIRFTEQLICANAIQQSAKACPQIAYQPICKQICDDSLTSITNFISVCGGANKATLSYSNFTTACQSLASPTTPTCISEAYSNTTNCGFSIGPPGGGTGGPAAPGAPLPPPVRFCNGIPSNSRPSCCNAYLSSPPSPSPTNSPSPSSSPTPAAFDSGDIGGIVGGIAGGVALLLVLGVLFFFCVVRRRREKLATLIKGSRDTRAESNASSFRDTASPLPPRPSIPGSSGTGSDYQQQRSSHSATNISSAFNKQWIALSNFDPRRDDELEFKAGDHITLLSIFNDGWAQGVNERTGSLGAAPMSLLREIN
ncbi:uncharacterized protein BJ171DRAFT_73322 [Polychytrium aggregatum]|uniref:uncharacterized protein n=1 Tax=Polychytrium aggregatum TaxID=110093 RepID=UPI0022FF07CD|nr:uncharacterized protein BJ171DRAFT_73322 [Polychytrium aggregatum]KAI9205419.1 hypothetical protein BJ171DRAFT_73322 [Polychytrium aggregatum]